MNVRVVIALAGLALASLSSTAIAQAPIPGQPYQVPAGYEAYAAGTLISYGGYNYVIQGDGTMLLAQQPATPPSMPSYPYYNPQVGGSSYVTPGTFNPYTGTTTYNTGSTDVYNSYYQPGRNLAAQGSLRTVYQQNPDGTVTTGQVWVDQWGNPHGNVTTTGVNQFGGLNQRRLYYSPGPNYYRGPSGGRR